MTWTKIGGEFLNDPVLLALPRGARLLHIEGTVWSNQTGTDGRIPRHMLARITDELGALDAVALLVDAGLWEPTQDGWLITRFLDHQPSAADVQKMQARGVERIRRHRQHGNGDHSLCSAAYCHQAKAQARNGVTAPVSNSAPYRPVPLRRSAERDGAGPAALARVDPAPQDRQKPNPSQKPNPTLSFTIPPPRRGRVG